jgi:hypothetical protein
MPWKEETHEQGQIYRKFCWEWGSSTFPHWLQKCHWQEVIGPHRNEGADADVMGNLKEEIEHLMGKIDNTKVKICLFIVLN